MITKLAEVLFIHSVDLRHVEAEVGLMPGFPKEMRVSSEHCLVKATADDLVLMIRENE